MNKDENNLGTVPVAGLPWWFWFLIVLIFAAVAEVWCWSALQGENLSGFEGLSALFSGLAFVGLFGALYMQRQELSLQRKELVETRKVLQETAKANQEVSEIAQKNLRSQYLIRWLDQNAEMYKSYSRFHDVHKNDAGYMSEENQEYTREARKRLKATDEEIEDFVKMYTGFRNELNFLNQYWAPGQNKTE